MWLEGWQLVHVPHSAAFSQLGDAGTDQCLNHKKRDRSPDGCAWLYQAGKDLCTSTLPASWTTVPHGGAGWLYSFCVAAHDFDVTHNLANVVRHVNAGGNKPVSTAVPSTPPTVTYSTAL